MTEEAVPQTSTINKTTITFTALHRASELGRILSSDSPLALLIQESFDGDMVGAESDIVTVELPSASVAAELVALGNDGEFFNDEPTDAEAIEHLLDSPAMFACTDCDSGRLTTDVARWHAEHEGHCVVAIDDDDTDSAD